MWPVRADQCVSSLRLRTTFPFDLSTQKLFKVSIKQKGSEVRNEANKARHGAVHTEEGRGPAGRPGSVRRGGTPGTCRDTGLGGDGGDRGTPSLGGRWGLQGRQLRRDGVSPMLTLEAAPWRLGRARWLAGLGHGDMGRCPFSHILQDLGRAQVPGVRRDRLRGTKRHCCRTGPTSPASSHLKRSSKGLSVAGSVPGGVALGLTVTRRWAGRC